MAYPIDKKLVIGIASSALFDLTESDKVFRDKGEVEYRKYQEKNIDNILKKGVAFSFIRRFLSLNDSFPEDQPVEVVLLSRNSPETGLRVFHSIQEYKLKITRAAFFLANLLSHILMLLMHLSFYLPIKKMCKTPLATDYLLDEL